MVYDIESFIGSLLELLNNFYYSPLMLVIKILIGIYLLVILADIVMLLILRDVPSNLRVSLRGMDLPLASKKKMQSRWGKIKSRLKNENDDAQYKIAIIEADAIAQEVLAGIGYKGANMTEKLDQIGSAQIDDHLEALRGAHEIRNRIVNEPDFVIDQRMAVAVIGVYENFLEYLEFIS